MAIGDVVTDAVSVGAGADADYQPAAGVETCITAVALNNNTSLWAILYDGTDSSIILIGQSAYSANMKLFINNTTYLRLHNDTGGALAMGYSGVQIG